ncbi:putative transcriptional activator, Baf family protein [Calothrix sp. NIES-4071]|nr:putative transcriptional activator, Baf family protein [Calothrix sp. NIES-4071]BAZ62367.1 putative transcriptional activator, Baf family protein [Calothrix sp. NIES-4105]
MSESWLGLMIGNSRLHWGLFDQQDLIYSWDSDYLLMPLSCLSPNLPLILASVVPSQTAIWQNYPNVKIITLQNISIGQMYPTFGIDRALAVFGAGRVLGFPILVIDAGTALTFTGADSNQALVGGAILPGLSLQLGSLSGRTGQLPNIEPPQKLPLRWAMNTPEAIQSGVIYNLLAGIKDFVTHWWDDFPQSKVVMTGGNSSLLNSYLQSTNPEIAARMIVERDLIFWGMKFATDVTDVTDG